MKRSKETIIYVDMDNVLCDFDASNIASRRENLDVEYQHSLPMFFENLDPLDDAIKTFKWLEEHFDVWILTAPSVYNPLNYTEKRNWVEKHLGFDTCYKLIISPNKGLLMGDYLIDDNINGKGQEGFQGTLLHFGSDKFKTWKNIHAYFNQILSKKIKKPVVLTGMPIRFGTEDINGRIYSKDSFSDAIQDMQEKVDRGVMLGTLGRNNSPDINLGSVSHQVTKLGIDEKGIYTEIKVLDTPAGKKVKEMLDAGVNLTIGSRSIGNVNEDGTIDPHEGAPMWWISQPEAHSFYLISEEYQKIQRWYVNNMDTEIIIFGVAILGERHPTHSICVLKGAHMPADRLSTLSNPVFEEFPYLKDIRESLKTIKH